MDVDTREVDRIIGEVASMAARWGTYRLFLTGRLTSPPVEAEGAGLLQAQELRKLSIDAKRAETRGLTLSASQSASREADESIAANSQLGVRMTELMEGVYVPLESWFLRCSIEKAHRMDTVDLSARPLSSSLLDDIFYLVRMVIARTISTSSMDVLSSMARNVRYIVDEDFVQALVRRMDSVWKSSSTSMTVEGPRKDAASREMRSTFVVYLNVLATSAEHMSRIINELSSDSSLAPHYVESELPLAASTVQGLSVLVPRIRNAVRTHLELLFTTLLKPKLRQLLGDSLRDVSYLINEEDYSRLEDETGSTSTFVRRFTRGWDNLLASSNYRQLFISDNWEAMLRLAIETVVQGWEEWVMNARYSELGALCFDKDLRALSNFLSSQSTLGGLRERFARLTHISYLVNLDDDVDDVQADGVDAGLLRAGANANGSHGNDVAWRLSQEEVTMIRQRRVAW